MPLSYAERARASNEAAAEKHAAARLQRLIEAGNTAAVFALLNQGLATNEQYRAAYTAKAQIEGAALRAPLTNKDRCDAVPFRGTFPLKGNFYMALRVAFFDRKGVLIEETASGRIVYADDEMPSEINKPAGACFMRWKIIRDERYGGDLLQIRKL